MMYKFLDLQKINATYEPELTTAIREVVGSGWYIQGKALQQFEQEYASYIGTRHCIGAANGLDALTLILRAMAICGRITPGDEVIVPANTFIASLLAIRSAGMVPVPAEPSLENYNLDPVRLPGLITQRTRAVMVVHLYGRNGMTHELERICREKNLWLIEDNAQAQGCYHANRRTGSLGLAAGHSFYPGKNLGALGDAGAVTTDDDELATTIRSLGNYGSSAKYIHDLPGVNSRLDDLQAAVLSVKLRYLDRDNGRRNDIARCYLENISHPSIVLPHHPENERPVWHLFVIRAKERDRLQKYLEQQGVQTLIHYPVPTHRQGAFPELAGLDLPVTEQIHREVLSLPISPVMTTGEALEISKIINQFKT